MTSAWRACSVPFCKGSGFCDEDHHAICHAHMMVVTHTHQAFEDWLFDATISGLAGLPSAGDEARARARVFNRRRREAAA